ncbi:DUF1758 domain-containing protein [Aphis craccivora]|uniref:DUF1758 domain-containing protein n=1 Tax=Aphis craccivora TaxID=307492 RepID=A0A6G0Y420_APHCR|nr:DUF1758 domain-containing protein [Aphis craccivora]
MYTALIHDNNNLRTTIRKFFYLRSSLSDDAATCVKNLETTTDNYEQAWNSLVTRYNNKKLLVQIHVKGVCDLPTALRALKQHPSEWGPLLTHIICTKIDAITISDWETKCARDQIKEVDELIEFLESRFHVLEAVESSKRISNVSKNVIENNYASRKGQYTKNTSSSTSFFIALSVINRIKKIIDLNLCKICLRHHNKKKCFARYCFKCAKPHNTMLHIDNYKRQ